MFNCLVYAKTKKNNPFLIATNNLPHTKLDAEMKMGSSLNRVLLWEVNRGTDYHLIHPLTVAIRPPAVAFDLLKWSGFRLLPIGKIAGRGIKHKA